VSGNVFIIPERSKFTTVVKLGDATLSYAAVSEDIAGNIRVFRKD